MNNMKKMYILGGVLIVAVALILISENIGKRKASSSARAFFPKLTEAEISAFQVADDKDTVKVFRKGDIWMVRQVRPAAARKEDKAEGGIPDAGKEEAREKAPEAAQFPEYSADSASVHSVLEKLVEMKKDILVSKNPDKQETFEVDSAHGVLVEVWNRKNESLGTFRIGKSGPNWSSNYVRTIGANDVWAVSGSIKGSFFAELKRWRDKSIAQFDVLQAKELSISYSDTAESTVVSLKIEKKLDSVSNVTWALVAPEKAPAKKDEVESVLKNFSGLKTVDWDSTAADTAKGWDDPQMVIQVVLDNGEKKRVIAGKKEGSSGKIFVKADGSDETYLVYESTLNAFKKKLDDLKEPPKAEEKKTDKESEKKE
jgi:hypothetical protein